MKKFVKTGLMVALCLVAMLSFTACSKFGSIKKAFEKEGYTYSTETNDRVSKVQEEFKKEDGTEIACTPHLFTKGVNLVVIFEFKSTKEMEEAVKDSATLKGLIQDAQNSDYVNGNCVFFSFDVLNLSGALDIFKNA